MTEKSSKTKYIFDSLIVLFNLAGARGNILLYWLTGLNRTTLITGVVLVVDILYCFLRFSSYRKQNSIKYPPVVIIIISLLFINILNMLLEGKSIILQSM